MTVSTNALCRSRLALCVGLFSIFVSLAFQTAAQIPHPRSVEADEHLAAVPSAVESVADVNEASTDHATSDASQRLGIPQTETKRQPNLPVAIVTQALKGQEESAVVKTEPTIESGVAEKPAL